jgi:hypothetical protein
MTEITGMAAVKEQRPNPDKSLITAIFFIILFLSLQGTTITPFKNATGVLAAAHKSAMLTKYIFVLLPLHSITAALNGCPLDVQRPPETYQHETFKNKITRIWLYQKNQFEPF